MRDPRVTPDEERRIGVSAGCDPRVLRTYLAGKARSTSAARIEQALRDLGRADLIRPRSGEQEQHS
jgi:hypothetical protein